MKNSVKRNYIISDLMHVYLRKFNPGSCTPSSPLKTHSTLYYIVSGEIECIKNAQSILLKKNDFLFWDYGDKIDVINHKSIPCLCYIIGYKASPVEAKHSEFGIPTYGNISDESFQNMFPKLYNSWDNSNNDNNFKVFSLLYNIFHKISYKNKTENILGEQYYKLQRAVQYVYTNYKSKIEIDDLCKASGYSRVHLHRLFIDHFSVPPRKFINDFKISRAKLTLGNAAASISEIAEELGYADVSHFCKIFKKYTSYTPSEYRKMYYSDLF